MVLYIQGNAFATTVINGTTKTYLGVVSRSRLGEKRTNGSGYLDLLLPPVSATGVTISPAGASTGSVIVLPPGISFVNELTRIPLYLDLATAYGGLQQPDGSSLVFHANRVVAINE